MGKTKVFLDTNLLISALGWPGNLRVIFEKCLPKGTLELVSSPQHIEELKRVLNYPKFNFSEEQKVTFVSLLLEIATIVDISGNLKVIQDDPDDDAILETALVGNVDYLITGDVHLLRLHEFAKIRILTPKAFLDL